MSKRWFVAPMLLLGVHPDSPLASTSSDPGQFAGDWAHMGLDIKGQELHVYTSK